MHHAPAVRHTRHSSSRHTAIIIGDRLVAVNATSVLCGLVLPLRHGAKGYGRLRPGLAAQNTPGNANLPIGVVSEWNRTEPHPHTNAKAHAHYNNGSRREGMLYRALFRPAVSFAPASARSGLPPPEPPSCLASACISLPAWTLAVRSLVTPAIKATFP